MKLHIGIIGWLALLVLLVGACSEDAPPSLSGSITINPAEPVPGAAFNVDIEAKVGGSPAAGATVILFTDLNGVSGGFGIDAVEVEPGLYRAEVTLEEEGSWTLTASVIAGAVSGDITGQADALCLGDRGAGQTCCGTESCGGDLWCDANACNDSIRPDGIVCSNPDQCGSGFCTNGLCASPWDIIGTGDGSPQSVTLQTVISDRLNVPTDLAFDPEDGELWVTGRALDQLTVLQNPTDQASQPVHFFDRSKHFLEAVVTLSFGTEGTFATCGESRNTYDDLRPANDFMGPAMWPSDMEDFQVYGPDAANVHLDMLHNSPNCMGIEYAGSGNIFFAFNGLDGVLDWYDFHEPHPDRTHGGEDHSDGAKRRYTEVQLGYVPGVPSHMVLDDEQKWLYIADTGNGRIIRVDVNNATDQGRIQSFFGDGLLNEFTGVVQETIVDGLDSPSGIALYQGIIFVSDNATGVIHAFQTDGTKVNELDTGSASGALAGIEVGPEDGLLYYVNQGTNRVIRILP